MLSKPATKQQLSGPDGLRDSVWPLAALLTLAAIVRVHAWTQTAVLFNDGPVFLALSEAIVEGRWAEVLAHPYHPFYPVCIAIVSLTGLSAELSAVAVSIFGGLLGIVAVFAMWLRVWGRDIAWLGAWVLTLHPWAIDFSSDVMSDGLYAGLYLASFAFLAEWVERPHWKAGAACGGLAAMAFLTRPEGLGLVPIACLLVAARSFFDPSLRSIAMRSSLGLLLVAGIVVGPYVVFMSAEAGEWTWTQKKSIAALATGEPVAPEIVEGVHARKPLHSPIWLPQSASPLGAGQPSRDLGGVAETVSRVIRTSAASMRYEVLLFVCVGFVVLWHARTDRRWHLAAVGLPILLYSGLLMLLVWGAGYVSRRHALAVWIPMIGVAAIGWEAFASQVVQRWRRWRRRGVISGSVSPRAICLGLVVVLLMVWGPRDLRERRMDRTALRTAAEWLARTHPDSGAIAAEKLRVSYYGKAAFVPLRADPVGGLEAALRVSRARWVIIDRDHLDRIPELEEGMGDWLEPVYSVEEQDRGALVFEIH